MRTVAVLLAFAAGAIVGMIAVGVQPPAPKVESPYGTLGAVPEPAVGAAIASAIERGDADVLARDLDAETAQGLGRALQPVPLIERVRFAGAAQLEDRILASYVVTGSDGQSPAVAGYTVAVDGAGTVIAIQ